MLLLNEPRSLVRYFASRGKVTKTLVVLIFALLVPNRLASIADS